jgi:hypothetical protein
MCFIRPRKGEHVRSLNMSHDISNHDSGKQEDKGRVRWLFEPCQPIPNWGCCLISSHLCVPKLNSSATASGPESPVSEVIILSLKYSRTPFESQLPGVRSVLMKGARIRVKQKPPNFRSAATDIQKGADHYNRVFSNRSISDIISGFPRNPSAFKFSVACSISATE